MGRLDVFSHAKYVGESNFECLRLNYHDPFTGAQSALLRKNATEIKTEKKKKGEAGKKSRK